MTATDDLVISTEKLTKSYNGKPVLKSLDLKVPKHSIFGFLGPNGAGKTTTIKLILGLIRPTSGSCAAFGMDTVGNSIKIRHRIGYLAQDPRYYEYMTARETLRFTAKFFYEGPRDEIEARIEDTLKLVAIDDKADRPIKGFSGGERQRLGIAQAYINHPELLILDEPAASLDPMGRRDVLELMSKIRSETTIFYSTHILDDVQKVSDIVAILNHGELVAQAPIEQLLAGKGSISYRVVVKGDAASARAKITQMPWVSAVNAAGQNGHTALLVSVTDDGQAEDSLLETILSSGVKVIEFGRKKQDLEDVFMDLVEVKNNAS
ncbi:MAG: Trehalose/maltose import ATP-binding protein MalK [Methanocella sp. PtaU1.Bin125]|nr:MAG: Trehalose/maltose import ATP-binding protein MalK [Methanocella sp. PtaU1.Bin125]